MAKNKITEWESNVNGKNYKFVYQKIKGGHELEVNGAKQVIKAGGKSVILGFDEEFDLDGKPARLVLEDKAPDVAVDGILIRSGKEYVSTPSWVMIFSIACFVLLFVGGVIGAVIGVLGSMACIAIAKKPMPTLTKMILCVVVTVITWVLALLIAGAVAGMLLNVL